MKAGGGLWRNDKEGPRVKQQDGWYRPSSELIRGGGGSTNSLVMLPQIINLLNYICKTQFVCLEAQSWVGGPASEFLPNKRN